MKSYVEDFFFHIFFLSVVFVFAPNVCSIVKPVTVFLSVSQCVCVFFLSLNYFPFWKEIITKLTEESWLDLVECLFRNCERKCRRQRECDSHKNNDQNPCVCITGSLGTFLLIVFLALEQARECCISVRICTF